MVETKEYSNTTETIWSEFASRAATMIEYAKGQPQNRGTLPKELQLLETRLTDDVTALKDGIEALALSKGWAQSNRAFLLDNFDLSSRMGLTLYLKSAETSPIIFVEITNRPKSNLPYQFVELN
ncbi:MAG: hypothetical protein UT34_C0001G0125 [candidate division WS6 bacterium GW2011_GWF2_39_15]|uniref:Uncharacterized protein n=1 Tax=candidate division WS6 bacterium GW2011_GWF2_39_15 TaxID=1619100 RepID=A0A0G0Q6S0_9BACT|nr:MAG: hypothetical protein UT34_C0001G0125 [candidate division WS6 bacterium GW2011_GWF2_39_15]